MRKNRPIKTGVRGRKRPSILSGIGSAIRLAREHAEAVDNFKNEYDRGGTLEECLNAFSRSTSHQGDDQLGVQVIDHLAHLRGISYNASVLASEFALLCQNLSGAIDDLAFLPLRDVLEESEDGGDRED